MWWEWLGFCHREFKTDLRNVEKILRDEIPMEEGRGGRKKRPEGAAVTIR